ncbi:MAG: 23S rRNA (uridine(2552)-2'-O)-methyltransferase RlmE [Gammaproteobacteria bacterium]
MPRSKSSKRWLKRQADDPYVKQARAAGYRSRAVYKLIEIDRRDRLLQAGQTVIDLGAAPGGWSQLAAERVGPGGQVIASDILPMEPLPGVTFVQGDFRDEAVLQQIIGSLENGRTDLVISDMAPNISGMAAVDQPRAMHLAELALEFAQLVLKPGGSMLVKLFQGEGFDEYLKMVRTRFEKTTTRKPEASRSRSRETYLLARNYEL